MRLNCCCRFDGDLTGAAIGDGLTPLNHHVQSLLQSAQQTYFDVFWIGVVVSAVLVVLVLLL